MTDDELYKRMSELLEKVQFRPPHRFVGWTGSLWYIDGELLTWEQFKEYIDGKR